MEPVPSPDLKRATIRDVAKRAGVGLGTVSRVINNSPNVRESTREKVLEAIEALDYRPSPIARRLSLGRTYTLAAVIPFFTRPAAVERLRGIASTSVGSEYDLIVFDIESPERRDECFRDLANRERVDGVLVISLLPSEQDLDRFRRASMPVVFIDINHERLDQWNRVIVDDVAGGRMATQHLIDLGHRRIGFISDPLEGPFAFTSSKHRFEGYQRALTDAGQPLDPALWMHGEHGGREARRMAEALLGLEKPPTAIFASSDTQAMGVLEVAKRRGLNVPHDLSLLGYDDIETAEFVGLTTIRQHLLESGREGRRLLMEVLEGRTNGPSVRTMPAELVQRETTAAPAKET